MAGKRSEAMTRRAPAPGESAPPRLVEIPWYQRLNLINTTFLIFLVGVISSFGVLQGSGREIDYLDSLLLFIGRFFPPDFSNHDQIFASLLETIQIAITATFFSVILSFALALGAAQNIAPGWLVTTMRMILNLVRTLPSLIWALLAVAVVGANPLAGVIGLTFYSVGYLGKFFSEAFESVDLEVARSLQTIGADRLQAFQYGMWPNAKPLIWSYSLWMFEYNIRSSSIVGYVGAGGIGLQLHLYQELGQWDRFGAVLLCILVIVSLLDLLGEAIRRRLSRGLDVEPIAR